MLYSQLVCFSQEQFSLRGGSASEFMPPLNEGDLMYMPITDPAVSMDEALRLIRKQDEILKSFPEVKSAVGKGRAGRHFDGSGPAEHERNDHSAETEERMARPASPANR